MLNFNRLNISAFWFLAPSLLFVFYLYLPFFVNGDVQIHGDGVVFGVAMLHLLKESLLQGSLPLWSDQIYGGHPVFAESQMGGLNPINMLISVLFEPIVAHTVLHVIYLASSALGMFLLCRQLKISDIASGFATLALVSSSLWLGTQNNLPVSATAMCIPWVLYSFERFYSSLTIKDGVLFATISTLTVFSGYPHIIHGIVVFLICRVLVDLLRKRQRVWVLDNIQRIFLLSVLVLLVALLMSAGQLLPLLELASYSHRSEGIGFLEATGAQNARGFFFTLIDHQDMVYQNRPDAEGKYEGMRHFNVVGSIFVCWLAALSVLSIKNKILLPYLVATFLLINLGFSNASPLFKLIYNYHLIPGMNQFRIMIPYFHVGIIGICVLAGVTVNRLYLSKAIFESKLSAWLVISITLLLALVVFYLHNEFVSWWHYFAPISLLLLLLLRIRCPNIPIAKVVFLLLIVEVLALRLEPFKLGSSKFYQKPESAIQLFTEKERHLYKHWDNSLYSTYGMWNPVSDRLPDGLKNALLALVPTTNVFWDVQSLDGGMALQQARREIIENELYRELLDINYKAGGTRLLNTLSVKYITHQGKPITQNMVYKSSRGIRIYENTDALPKFRIYTKAVFVESSETALNTLKTTPEDTIVIESDLDKNNWVSVDYSDNDFNVIKSHARFYEVNITADTAGWFFIADANYPGWNAYLNGEKIDVFSAQVLGKVVRFPPGQHVLQVRYEPNSFYLGITLTVIGIFIAILLVLYERRKAL